MKKSIAMGMRLTLNVAALLVVLFGAIGYTLWAFNAQKNDALVINLAGRQRMLSQKYTKEILDEEFNHLDEKNWTSGKTKELFEVTLSALKDGGTSFTDLTMEDSVYVPRTNSNKIQAKLSDVTESWKKLQASVDGLRSSDNGTDEHTSYMKEILGLNVTVLQQMNQGVTLLQSESDSRISSAIMGLYIGVGVALLTFGLVILYIYKGIVRPLNSAVMGLMQGTSQSESSSAQVSSVSQLQATGASKQAATVEETKSSLEVITSMTQQNAKSADDATVIANSASKSADEGVKSMEKMSTAIEEIKSSANETAKIVKTIDEIAFQTNLLALNAAVEAARAGDAGKGFAVVAEEVRSLALRSAEAAKNTAEMIEESVNNANNGYEISREVAEALEEITNSSNKVNTLLSEIAAASNEQAQGVEQINVAIEQIDDITQSNAASAEESASICEELNSQAIDLNRIAQDINYLVKGTNTSDVTMQNNQQNQQNKWNPNNQWNGKETESEHGNNWENSNLCQTGVTHDDVTENAKELSTF